MKSQIVEQNFCRICFSRVKTTAVYYLHLFKFFKIFSNCTTAAASLQYIYSCYVIDTIVGLPLSNLYFREPIFRLQFQLALSLSWGSPVPEYPKPAMCDPMCVILYVLHTISLWHYHVSALYTIHNTSKPIIKFNSMNQHF